MSGAVLNRALTYGNAALFAPRPSSAFFYDEIVKNRAASFVNSTLKNAPVSGYSPLPFRRLNYTIFRRKCQEFSCEIRVKKGAALATPPPPFYSGLGD